MRESDSALSAESSSRKRGDLTQRCPLSLREGEERVAVQQLVVCERELPIFPSQTQSHGATKSKCRVLNIVVELSATDP